MKLLSCFNFMCLLNLPEATVRFGPLRNLWEGGFKGEAIISLFKNQLCMGLRKNWERNSLAGMLREKAFYSLRSSFNDHAQGPIGCLWSQLMESAAGQYNCFPSEEAIRNCLENGQPISLVQVVSNPSSGSTTTRHFAVVELGQPEPTLLLELVPDEQNVRMKFGMRYEKWQPHGSSLPLSEMNSLVAGESHRVTGAVLLPVVDLIDTNGTKHCDTKAGLHTLISPTHYSS
jgi:hypothetical protein